VVSARQSFSSTGRRSISMPRPASTTSLPPCQARRAAGVSCHHVPAMTAAAGVCASPDTARRAAGASCHPGAVLTAVGSSRHHGQARRAAGACAHPGTARTAAGAPCRSAQGATLAAPHAAPWRPLAATSSSRALYASASTTG
jgi:hypothetical protein